MSIFSPVVHLLERLAGAAKHDVSKAEQKTLVELHDAAGFIERKLGELRDIRPSQYLDDALKNLEWTISNVEHHFTDPLGRNPQTAAPAAPAAAKQADDGAHSGPAAGEGAPMSGVGQQTQAGDPTEGNKAKALPPGPPSPPVPPPSRVA